MLRHVGGVDAEELAPRPLEVAQGTYLVSISGTDTGGTPFASKGCSAMTVTTTNTTLNACLPTSSLAVALGKKVTAYVPRGYWSGSSTGLSRGGRYEFNNTS